MQSRGRTAGKEECSVTYPELYDLPTQRELECIHNPKSLSGFRRSELLLSKLNRLRKWSLVAQFNSLYLLSTRPAARVERGKDLWRPNEL